LHRGIIRLTVDEAPVRAAILERLDPAGDWVGMLRFTDG
jgi:hypothetical protein